MLSLRVPLTTQNAKNSGRGARGGRPGLPKAAAPPQATHYALPQGYLMLILYYDVVTILLSLSLQEVEPVAVLAELEEDAR